jgi:hypothetical protein
LLSSIAPPKHQPLTLGQLFRLEPCPHTRPPLAHQADPTTLLGFLPQEHLCQDPIWQGINVTLRLYLSRGK